MPVRSLTSCVLAWPSREAVERAARSWCREAVRGRTEVQRIGYFGSYAAGTAGVGSDLDLVVIVDRTDVPFVRRALEWDTSALPVPTDLLVYTADEWHALHRSDSRFARMLRDQTRWLFVRDEASA